MARRPLISLILAFTTIPIVASAQAFTILHMFTGKADGSEPHGRLYRDPEGNLYGTTRFGGVDEWGTLFRLDAQGNHAILHFFNPNDGIYPVGGVVPDSQHNGYGTTYLSSSGNGLLYKIDRFRNETVLHNFVYSDGIAPFGELVRDPNGNLYGTTSAGGSHNYGTLFELAPNGDFTVLHNFAGPGDGSYPFAGVIRDSSGKLYGTTSSTVFEFDTVSGTFTVLHTLDQTTGFESFGSLVQDSQGNLYGTTFYGAAGNCGDVFKVDLLGNYTVLHAFTCAADGAYPYAGLTFGPDGSLYGTTSAGGSSNYGTVFQMDTSGNERVLHNFNGRDGASPDEQLILDAAGNIYGTTEYGGHYSGVGQGDGVVFKLSP